MTYIDPLSIEDWEEHKQKELFKIEREWVDKIALLDPEGYNDILTDWREHELDAKFWREFEKDKWSNDLKGEAGYSQIPTLIVPRMLYSQMKKRFGPEWARFNFLRYGIWLFYPTLRTTRKYYGKKKGIDKNRISQSFNT